MMQMMNSGGGGGGASSSSGGGGGKGSGKKHPMKAGDWICGSCGDHQFARNEVCKMCSAPKASAKKVQEANDLDQSCKMVPPAQQYEIDQFLSEHTVEAHAIERLQALDPRLQRVVIAKGAMTDARDQTAVLMK